MYKIFFVLILCLLLSACGNGNDIQKRQKAVELLTKQMKIISSNMQQMKIKIEKAKQKQGILRSLVWDSKDVDALEQQYATMKSHYKNCESERSRLRSKIPGTIENQRKKTKKKILGSIYEALDDRF